MTEGQFWVSFLFLMIGIGFIAYAIQQDDPSEYRLRSMDSEYAVRIIKRHRILFWLCIGLGLLFMAPGFFRGYIYVIAG